MKFWCCAFGAIGCAFAPNIWWLIGLRFVLGIGIGGYPVSATIMSEYSGKATRGMMVTLVFVMQAAGLIVGPLFASALLAANLPHDISWRILAFGAIPVLAVYWARRHLRRHLKEAPDFCMPLATKKMTRAILPRQNITIPTSIRSLSGMVFIGW